MSSVNVDAGNRKFKLFVCPGVTDCVKLCKTFIGQGTTICMNMNCLKNHRQKRTVIILPGQLFVAKSKDIVFAEPMSEALVDVDIVNELKAQNLTLSDWREKFEVINQVGKDGSNVDSKVCKEEELKMEFAKDYKTPLKRRVRETLEEDDVVEYSKLDLDDKLTLDKAQEFFHEIDKALKTNQDEHQKFRDCQIELEDNFREISFASKFKSGLLSRRLDKRPKVLDPKFDGPDLYSVVGTVASELVEVGKEVKEKVSKNTLLSEFTTRQTNITNRFDQDMNVLKRELATDFKRELDKMRINYESQIKQVRSGWVGAFGNMKNAFKEVVLDLRTSMDRLEADNLRAVTMNPTSTPGHSAHAVDLSGIHDDIDRLQDRIDELQEDFLKNGSDSPDC